MKSTGSETLLIEHPSYIRILPYVVYPVVIRSYTIIDPVSILLTSSSLFVLLYITVSGVKWHMDE